MIVCPACSYSNQLGRIFCQKCGTKLDLSKVRPPGQAGEKDGESGGITIGIRKDEKKKGKSVFKVLIKLFDVVVIVVVGFCLYQIWQEPPVKVPGTSSLDGEKLKNDREKLDFAISNKRPFEVGITDMALNSYLALVSDIGKASDTSSLRTEKITLLNEKELVDVVYVRKIVIGSWQKNVVMQYWGRPLAESGDFRFQPVRGMIGNLQVPSFALNVYERNFARLFQNFGAERALLGKLTQIQVEPGKATLIYKPKPAK